jgi:hypothetical protein
LYFRRVNSVQDDRGLQLACRDNRRSLTNPIYPNRITRLTLGQSGEDRTKGHLLRV